MKRIGILGGTFDPVHFGHLVAASCVRSEFHLDGLVFIPAGLPPHKENVQTTASNHRLKMLELAIGSETGFEVSAMELEQSEPSYSIKTARALREIYSESAEIFYIIGVDSALELQSWRDIDELLSLLKFVVVPRPGYSAEGVLEKYSGKCIFAEIPSLDISSSRIRERVRKGLPVKYLLPEKVRQYILQNGLYK